MRVGLAFASSVSFDGPSTVEVCKRAEEAGFESVWGGEHVIRPDDIESPYPYTKDGKIPMEPDTPLPDPLIWLAYAAAVAPTLRLGTCILIVPQRNPLILAKELASLDQLSGGKVELGLGVGWMKEEFDALGVPWERRGARNDEYIEAMRALWSAPHAEFHGEFVDFPKVTSSPRPVNGDIPILVGGDTDVAIRRAVKLADGYFAGEGDAQRLSKLLDRVKVACDKADRDYGTLEINTMFGAQMADPEKGIAELKELDVGRIMLPAFFFAGPGGLDRLSEFGEKYIPMAKG